ncbi:HMG-box domain-containing protein [Halopelagius longus]|uniref:Uncharacterized protein n=1 Tax=Halopelagius longus TaxID=1236180 RepID=A0A1H1A9M1_9EURY|nr:hypothetical protein [Halopelagius longus]RDI70293.1 hypothetical protein DWB78_00340 [Halopelagius longus]SDQ36347.1 hypothetical protein SAMN05216278_1231 [Halopelagius longus]
MTDTYVCPYCGATEHREYRVRLILLTCPECGENGRFLNEELVEVLDEIPDDELPEEWSELPADQRLHRAMERGLVDSDRLQLL